MEINKQILLAKRPESLPEEDTWKFHKGPMPEVGNGQILIKSHYISLDPAMRGWINDAKSYIPPVQVGEVMRAGSVGEVIQSSHDGFKVGEFVSGWGGVQQYVVTDGKGWHKVDPAWLRCLRI